MTKGFVVRITICIHRRMHCYTYIPHSDYITPYSEHAESSEARIEARSWHVFTCYTEQLPKSYIVMIRLARGDSYTLYLNRIYHRTLPCTTDIKTLLPTLLFLFYSCYFIYFRVFYVHMLSHALILMFTLLCVIYIYMISPLGRYLPYDELELITRVKHSTRVIG